MIICPKCQKQLPDGATFCDGCGVQFQQAVICPKCGNQTSASQPFCQVCGAQFAAPSAPAAPASAPIGEKVNSIIDTVKKLPKKTLGIIGGVAAAVVALVIIVAIVAGSGMPNYAIYTKDGELVYRELGKKSGVVVDEDASMAVLSSDGKTIFYATDKGLYYKNINKKNADGIKLISDYDDLAISENGKILTYIKGGDLYQKKVGSDESTKIAKEVYSFTVTPNGSKVLYTTNESDLYYVKKVGKDPIKVATGIDEDGIEYISEDLKTVVYIKEGELRTVVAGKDSNKIASDVSTVYAYDTKNIYFSVKNEIKEGDYVKETKYDFYLYNGKDKTKLASDNFNYILSSNKEKKIVIYSTEDRSEENRSYTYEYYLADGKNTYKFFDYTIKYDDNYKANSYDYISSVRITKDGKKVYYLVKTNDPDAKEDVVATGDLYEASADKKITNGKKIDNDVYELNYITTTYNKPVYSKEYNKEKENYELYINGKKIAEDVTGVSYDSYYTKAFYYTADDAQWYYKSGKPVKIGDKEDVSNLTILPTGDILYLTDVSETNRRGDLMLFNGKKSKKIDSDVSYIQNISYLEMSYEDGANLYLSAPGPKQDNPVVEDDYYGDVGIG